MPEPDWKYQSGRNTVCTFFGAREVDMVKRQRKHLQRRSRVFGADPQPSDYHNHHHTHSPQMPKLNAAVRSFSSDGGNVMHHAKGNGTPHIGQVVSGYDGHAVRLAPGFGDLEV